MTRKSGDPMPVYFIQRIADTSRIKVGTTDNLDQRLTALGSEYEGGIELLAQCEGGRDTEAAFHAMLSDDWIEGEWFRRSELLDRIIAKFSSEVSGRRVWGRIQVIENMGASAIDTDRRLARDHLEKLMVRLGVTRHAIAQARCFEVLHEINPLWSRRRVRAIWEGATRRIDHYEMRDLKRANGMTDSELFGAGSMDRPGN